MSGVWILKVGKDGRITLPKDLMEQMGWRVGDTLIFRAANDGAIVVQRVARSQKGRVAK
jgi:AbrB family looped-hinge helix DNA binding protein